MSDKSISYTGVVLLDEDRKRLLNVFSHKLPPDWKRSGHHMTINVGPAEDGPGAKFLQKLVELEVRAFAMDTNVAAVRVESECPSVNAIKHITLAVSPAGSAKDANNLKNWTPVQPFKIRGMVEEVQHEGGEPRQPKPHLPQSAPAPNDPKAFVQAMLSAKKPPDVIRMAMKGKFPNLTDADLANYIG